MAQAVASAPWEKGASAVLPRTSARRRWAWLGGLALLGVVLYILISTLASARYFITIDELLTNPAYAGQTVRVTGAVLGDSIAYDADARTITFIVSHIPANTGNLAQALHTSVNDPSMRRMEVRVVGQPMPDLLQHEAQAILTGQLGPDGVFVADELLLKCPSRFEGAGPEQAIAEAGA